MKPIKSEVHEPWCGNSIRITYHDSIRKAVKYCKENGIAKYCIYVNRGEYFGTPFGKSKLYRDEEE